MDEGDMTPCHVRCGYKASRFVAPVQLVFGCFSVSFVFTCVPYRFLYKYIHLGAPNFYPAPFAIFAPVVVLILTSTSDQDNVANETLLSFESAHWGSPGTKMEGQEHARNTPGIGHTKRQLLAMARSWHQACFQELVQRLKHVGIHVPRKDMK